jgi:PAN domain
MVGIALVIQACWQQEEDRLAHLGEGGCRTADGSEGEYTVASARSSEACEAQCRDTNGRCTAVEYNDNNRQCEIDHQPIAKYEQVEGVACYVRK